MSLSSTINKIIYNGDAFATNWPFSFPVLEADHLAVIFTDASGVETTLSPTLYLATGIGSPSGGSVTYPLAGPPIASGTKLTIVRTVPYTQTTVLSNQGGYYPEVVEKRFDQIYMALQQLEERVSRVSLSPISNPATEQGNYALIQPLQQMNLLTTQGDLLTRSGTAYKRLGRGTAGQFLGVSCADLAWAIPSQPVAPQGRLTLSSGEPVMTGDQTGKTTLYYTPYTGGFVPIYDGTAFVPTAFTERSNDLAQGAANKAGPVAAGPHQVIDAFVWNDSGIIRLTRGPKWIKAGTVTFTIATPGYYAWSGLTVMKSPEVGGWSLRNFAETIQVNQVVEANDVLAQRRGASAQMFRLYNTYTDGSNYERAHIGWVGNTFTIDPQNAAGTGTSSRPLGLAAGGTVLTLEGSSSLLGYSAPFAFQRNGTSAATLVGFGNSAGAGYTSTALNFIRVTPTINQTSGTYNVLDLNPTETAVGAGPHYLIRARIGAGADVFNVNTSGTLFAASHLFAGGASNIGWNGRGIWSAPADGIFTPKDNAGTSGAVIEFLERADPAAGGANTGRLYVRDNGGGKSQLVVRFNTGAVQVLATEP